VQHPKCTPFVRQRIWANIAIHEARMYVAGWLSEFRRIQAERQLAAAVRALPPLPQRRHCAVCRRPRRMTQLTWLRECAECVSYRPFLEGWVDTAFATRPANPPSSLPGGAPPHWVPIAPLAFRVPPYVTAQELVNA
jgi:hypothetical protein